MQYGIPVGNVPVARALTLPGYADAVAAGARKRGGFLDTAAGTVGLFLNNNVFNGLRNNYHQILAADAYTRLNGLGDDVQPPPFEVTDEDMGIPAGGTDPSAFVDQVLKDYNADQAKKAAQTSAGSSADASWWGSIIKTVAGPVASGIGLGIGGKIAGVNPWAKPPMYSPLTQMSTTTKLLLAGGGILVGGYVLSRLLKR